MAIFCATVHDPRTMILQMIVFPTFDAELDDPAFNPPGMVHTRHILSEVQAKGPSAFLVRIPNLKLTA